jgi:hypothetical protein
MIDPREVKWRAVLPDSVVSLAGYWPQVYRVYDFLKLEGYKTPLYAIYIDQSNGAVGLESPDDDNYAVVLIPWMTTHYSRSSVRSAAFFYRDMFFGSAHRLEPEIPDGAGFDIVSEISVVDVPPLFKPQ